MYALHFIRQRIATTIYDAQIASKWPQCQRFLCSKPSDIEIPQLQFVEKQQRLHRLQHADSEIDWDAEIQEMYSDDEAKRNRSVLAPVEDESEIYAEPMFRPTYHLAAYVTKSPTLQKLLKMGVNLHNFDRDIKKATFIASLDFDRHIKEHITFLTEIGLSLPDISRILTYNPMILQQSLDDLRIRVNYLISKRFTPENVTQIVKHNIRWLNSSTAEIDARLGYFQKVFRLNGNEVRSVAVTGPKLITEDEKQISEITFSVKEECAFTHAEGKAILLKCPSVWLQRMYIYLILSHCIDFHYWCCYIYLYSSRKFDREL